MPNRALGHFWPTLRQALDAELNLAAIDLGLSAFEFWSNSEAVALNDDRSRSEAGGGGEIRR